MRKLLILLAWLSNIAVFAQPTPPNDANTVLRKTVSRLNDLKKVSYQHVRETHYFADNYYNLMKADLYMELHQPGPLAIRFQAMTDKSDFVFDGMHTLRIDKENRTIDSASVTAKGMENNSYLYHSLQMLRNMIPNILANDSVERSVKDTLVNKKYYYNVRIEGPGMYFQLLGRLERFTDKDLRRPYYLLIDKNTYLPYQLIAKFERGTDTRDFVTVTYNNINTQPATVADASWNYATYAGNYKPYVAPVKIPLVKTGTLLADFTLPSYETAGIDSVSLHAYKGKLVLLDFWFKSCGPCMKAMPLYNDLQRKYAKDGFTLLTINVEDPVEDIRFFYNKHQPVYKMLYGGNKLWTGLGFTGCPSSVLVGKDGKVIETFFGFDEKLLAEKIAGVLSGS